MNEHAGYAVERGGKWWAMLRFPKDGQPKPVLTKCGAPMRFDTELEAIKTVNKHLVGYMNGPDYRRDGAVLAARSKADELFKLPPTIKQRGKQRPIIVERERREKRA